MNDWLAKLPKAELHLHIEGTIEPEHMLEMAARNGVSLPYDDVEDIRQAYDFANLQSFLDLYYRGMSVLCTARDFRELAFNYFKRAHAEGVVHVELSFDPQAHLSRGVSLQTQFDGLCEAMSKAENELGVTSALIMSFLRDQDEAEALDVFDRAEPWYDRLAAVGLDSAEHGNPPEKFETVFGRAQSLGIPRVAHAGEEGPPEYITTALDLLDVCRIDHGVSCLSDPALVDRLHEQQMPLTVCPLSNVSLRVVDQLADHPLPRMLDAGLNICLNSDDPAYFGGGMLANFNACAKAFGWDRTIFRSLATNAVEASFMSQPRRQQLLADIQAA